MVTLANEVWQMGPNRSSLFHPTSPVTNHFQIDFTFLFGEHNPSTTALVYFTRVENILEKGIKMLVTINTFKIKLPQVLKNLELFSKRLSNKVGSFLGGKIQEKGLLTLYQRTNFWTRPNSKHLQMTIQVLVTKMMISLSDRKENIVGKEENAGYQHFLLCPHCFQKPSFSGSLKVEILW